MDELATQEIRVNDLWHAENLDMLEQCLRYVEIGDYYAFEPLWVYYLRRESDRLRDRELMMRRHKIETLPHRHKERETNIMDMLIASLAVRVGKQEVAI